MRKALKATRGVAAAASMAVLVQGIGMLAIGPMADATDGAVVATANVHIRTSPTTKSQSLTILRKGTSIQSHGSSNGWTKVTYNGRTAYIASAYLAGSTVEVKTPTSSTGAQGGVFTTANLNLRVGPSLRDKVAVVAQRATRLSLTGKVSGDYAQVTFNGKTYWGASRYLSTTAAAAYHELPSAKGKMRGTAILMVRTTAGKSFVNLGDQPRGTIFDVTGVTANGMAQVIFEGRLRWVNAKFLAPVDAAVTAPAKPAPSTTPKTSTRYATALLNIWAASTGTKYSGTIPRGSELQVTGKVANGRAEVVVNGAVRWVTARYVSATKPAEQSSAAGGSSTSLNRGWSSGLDKVNPNAKRIAQEVWDRFPQIKTQYGWRRDITPDHPAGRAIDVMIPNYKSNQALGWEIAEYFRAHAKEYNINYIIFAQKIWSVQRSSEGWRKMADRGSDNANHYNHPHINTYG